MAEELIYPPKVLRYDQHGVGHIVDYELYAETIRTKKVGDLLVAYAGAPGTGRIVRQITRMSYSGIYGVTVEDSIRELEPWEVM